VHPTRLKAQFGALIDDRGAFFGGITVGQSPGKIRTINDTLASQIPLAEKSPLFCAGVIQID
jgi:hypothetical protein